MCAHREPRQKIWQNCMYVCIALQSMYALFLFIVIQDSFIIIIIGIININHYYLEFYIKEFDIIHRTCTQCPFWNYFGVFLLQKRKICVLFRRDSFLKCPEFTEAFPFLLIPHAWPVFLKYALYSHMVTLIYELNVYFFIYVH